VEEGVAVLEGVLEDVAVDVLVHDPVPVPELDCVIVLVFVAVAVALEVCVEDGVREDVEVGVWLKLG
jgi:hypothetical protein